MARNGAAPRARRCAHSVAGETPFSVALSPHWATLTSHPSSSVWVRERGRLKPVAMSDKLRAPTDALFPPVGDLLYLDEGLARTPWGTLVVAEALAQRLLIRPCEI